MKVMVTVIGTYVVSTNQISEFRSCDNAASYQCICSNVNRSTFIATDSILASVVVQMVPVNLHNYT